MVLEDYAGQNRIYLFPLWFEDYWDKELQEVVIRYGGDEYITLAARPYEFHVYRNGTTSWEFSKDGTGEDVIRFIQEIGADSFVDIDYLKTEIKRLERKNKIKVIKEAV